MLRDQPTVKFLTMVVVLAAVTSAPVILESHVNADRKQADRKQAGRKQAGRKQAGRKQAGEGTAKATTILEFAISINDKVTKTNNAERALSRLRSYAKRDSDFSMTVNVNGTIRRIDRVPEAIRTTEVVARVANLAKRARIQLSELGPIAGSTEPTSRTSKRREKTAATGRRGKPLPVAKRGRDGDDGLGGVGGGLGGQSSGSGRAAYNVSGRIVRGRVVGERRRQLVDTLRQMLISVMVAEETSSSLAQSLPKDKTDNLNKLGKTTLFARTVHRDYQKATFSFEFGVRDDPANRIGNDWDLQYGNDGNHFHVAMVSDDRSQMLDLGNMTWDQLDLAELPQLPPLPRPRRQMIPAVAGHMYLVHTVDRNTDLFAVFRVEKITQQATCDITWKRIRRR